MTLGTDGFTRGGATLCIALHDGVESTIWGFHTGRAVSEFLTRESNF